MDEAAAPLEAALERHGEDLGWCLERSARTLGDRWPWCGSSFRSATRSPEPRLLLGGPTTTSQFQSGPGIVVGWPLRHTWPSQLGLARVTAKAPLAVLPDLDSSIEVGETSVVMRDFVVESREVAASFVPIRKGRVERPSCRPSRLVLHCLECASSTRDVDFVRGQITELLSDVERAVEQIPTRWSAALWRNRCRRRPGPRPVRLLLTDVRSASSERLREVQTLLTEEIDPSRESSTLGKALRVLTDLLDPRRTDSVQGIVQTAVQAVATTDGALANVVKKTVADAVAPLANEVNRLALDFRGDHAAEEALESTTAKGVTYEAHALGTLSEWSRHTGARITHVGDDNRPGDIVIELDDAAGDQLRIVVEARDRRSALGRKGIADSLEKAMRERGCSAAIYVSHSVTGLTNEIGEWAEGTTASGDFIATVNVHLVTAVRFLVVKRRISRMKEAQRQVDEAAMQTQLGRSRRHL